MRQERKTHVSILRRVHNWVDPPLTIIRVEDHEKISFEQWLVVQDRQGRERHILVERRPGREYHQGQVIREYTDRIPVVTDLKVVWEGVYARFNDAFTRMLSIGSR
jgi:hypothetical protein